MTNPIYAATASMMKSLRRACRPGTSNCAISMEPEKMMRKIASKSCPSVEAQCECQSSGRVNDEMFEDVGRAGFRP
jgi:hypothetical protein